MPWCGPAPLVPYRSNMLPGIWRWWYEFGCGDIGNDGVHDIDVARRQPLTRANNPTDWDAELQQDLRKDDTPRWGYFCQISDSTTSYGSYSGAVPNEKITWGKLSADTPKFIIESDATIVAPLIFACVLGQ